MDDAETVYFFRHALVQQAAYDLQPSSRRGALHAVALEVMEVRFGVPPQTDHESFKPHPSDPHLLEYAEHATAACEQLELDDDHPIQRKTAEYLWRFARYENEGFRIQSALKYYRKLIAHPGVDAAMRFNAHVSAGQIHMTLGALEKSASEYDQAESCLNPNDEISAMLLKCCRTTLGSYKDNGPWVGDAHHESAEFWKKHGQTRRYLSSLVNFAIWHCEEGDPDVARKALREVSERAREINFRRAEEAAIGTLALLEGHLGNHVESEVGIRRALEIAREIGNLSAELHWFCALGGNQHDQGQLEAAVATYHEVLQIARSHGFDARIDYTEALLAEVYVSLGRMDDARKLWNSAWSRLTVRDDTYTSRTTREGMEELLQKLKLPPLNEDGSFPA